MKTIAASLLLVLVGLGMDNPQYKINKTKYDNSTWTHEEGDPYNPTTCGVLSFFIPSVGQMVAHKAGRGVAFLNTLIMTTICEQSKNKTIIELHDLL